MPTKKSPSQLQREIDEALARPPGARARTKKGAEGRGDPLSAAAGIVTSRVRSSEAYRLGQEEVVQAALEAIGPSPTVARLKELGGITAVVHAQVALASTPGLDSNLGTPMFPLTPHSLLDQESGVMRSIVQQLLSEQLLSEQLLSGRA